MTGHNYQARPMRLAIHEDIPEIEEIYRQSREHAFKVGYIDWPEKFPDGFFEGLIAADELFCFSEGNTIVAAARLSDTDNPAVWKYQRQPHLYIGKLASGDAVRGTHFIETVAIPAFEIEAQKRDKAGLRLNCLADNPGLLKLYSGMGFFAVGNECIYSHLLEKLIVTTKFEKIFR